MRGDESTLTGLGEIKEQINGFQPPPLFGQFTFTVPAQERWRPISINMLMQTGATVAVRKVKLFFASPTFAPIGFYPSLVGQEENLAYNYNWARQVAHSFDDNPIFPPVEALATIPMGDIELLPGSLIRILWNDLAGDDTIFNVNLTYKRWKTGS